VMIVSVSVCLSVHTHISKTTRPCFTNIACMLIVAVAQTFSGGFAIRYVLPVLWMMSCFHIVGSMACVVYAYITR